MEARDIDKVKELEQFLKMAFCVDGDCKFMQFDEFKNSTEKIMTFKLTDSKRGIFKVSLST
jgi:hypothetical protein